MIYFFYDSKFSPNVDKFVTSKENFNVTSVKKIFESLFNNFLYCKKLFKLSLSPLIYIRPFFSSIGLLSTNMLTESQLEFYNPYKFIYKIASDWKVKSFSNHFRKYDRVTLRKLLHITNIAFLGGFLFSNINQRLFLIFGSSFKYKFNWWELGINFKKNYYKIMCWWFRSKKKFKKNIFFFNGLLNDKFFLWDPLNFIEENKKKKIKTVIKKNILLYPFFFKFKIKTNYKSKTYV